MSTPYQKPVLLLATDDIAKLAFLKKHLQNDFHLLERTDEESILETVRKSLIDLIILDDDSKAIDALDLCRKIREISAYFGVPILLITRNIRKSFVDKALEAGISDFLNQPLDAREIETRLAVTLTMKTREEKVSELSSLIRTPQGSIDLSQRKVLSDQAIRAIAKARKNSELVSLLMIELEDPKEGDLAKLAEVLEQHLRKNDILIPQKTGRYVVMLPKTSPRAAEIIAETIDSELQDLKVAVSMGIFSLDQSPREGMNAIADFDHLIQGASRAIQEVRKNRNP